VTMMNSSARGCKCGATIAQGERFITANADLKPIRGGKVPASAMTREPAGLAVVAFAGGESKLNTKDALPPSAMMDSRFAAVLANKRRVVRSAPGVAVSFWTPAAAGLVPVTTVGTARAVVDARRARRVLRSMVRTSRANEVKLLSE